jgi:hypothetical protein
MLQYAQHGRVQAFLALTVFNLAAILAPVSAMADPPDVSADQGTAPESNQVNNGFDLTRPQSSFEVRGLDQPSSNNTSETNKAEIFLRVESKIPLDVDWRLGVLAQVPLVQKTTTDFEPLSVDHEFGLGDANFQVIVAHAIDERWAFGVGARVSAQTGPTALAVANGKSCRRSACAICCSNWGRTAISFHRCAMR